MIDSHAHVGFKQFDEDRDEVMIRAKKAGVTGWIEVGTDVEQSRRAVAMAEKHENVWATVGLHPTDIEGLDEAAWLELERLAQHKKVAAIGEVGFDLYRGGDLDEQKLVLEKFMELANRYDLPVIWHMRSSDEVDVNEVLIEYLSELYESERPRGVMHTFSGNMEQARKYLDLGLYLGFSGVVTFKNAGELIDIVREVPLDKILIETDCPFLAPEPHRGQRNEPAYVKLVAEKIAELRGVGLKEVDQAITSNTEQFFGIKTYGV